VENLPIRTASSAARGEGGGRIAAVLTRDRLESIGAVISGAHILRSAAFFATVISVTSAALGSLLTVFLCWRGAYHAARAGNLLLFMFSSFVSALLVCGFARFKR
jgi:hypothetical protein